jgi:hypothetical protein
MVLEGVITEGPVKQGGEKGTQEFKSNAGRFEQGVATSARRHNNGITRGPNIQ